MAFLTFQQSTPNGCLDACHAMLMQHFECKGAENIKGAYHNGVFVQEDTGRSLFTGMDSETFSQSLFENGLEQKALSQYDTTSIRNQLNKGPLLASIKFASGLSDHAILVVGITGDNIVINDPWHGGHQVKSLSWLKKNLNKSSTALCQITRMDNQPAEAPAPPPHATGKLSKWL